MAVLVVSLKWTKVLFDGPSPASRLDFAACTARINVNAVTAPTDTLDLALQVQCWCTNIN